MGIRTKLIKPKYNDDELIKAVDTDVDELISLEEPEELDLVQRSVYEEVLEDNNELSQRISELESIESDLQNEVTQLTNSIEQIETRLEQAKIAESISENQLSALRDQFQQLNIDFREALQKSIREGIEKVSLQAQNDGLRAEVNSLNSDLRSQLSVSESLREQLEGRQSQLEQGADIVGDVTVLNLQQSDEFNEDIRYETKYDDARNKRGKWAKGRGFRVKNTGNSTVTIKVDLDSERNWFTVSPSSFTLRAGDTRDISFQLRWSSIQSAPPRGTNRLIYSSNSHTGTLTIRVDETGQETQLQTNLRKRRN